MRMSTGAEGVDDLHLAYLLGANAIAGLETTSRQLMWFLVAAMTAPSVVARAQELLDTVVGRDRLPNLADRAKMPYLDAILLELLRWRCVAPNGVPHMVEREDVYEGFHIPAGSVVIANTWGIGRDEAAFGENVDDFVPERWLKSEPSGAGESDVEADWMHAAVRRDLPIPFFGYGRRMCTGRLLAEDGLWMVISRLLWAFNIRSADGSQAPDPNVIKPHGFTVIPAPFKASLVPRGPWVTGVVMQEWGSAEKDASVVLGAMPDGPY
ncbi:cytochrome P450 [Thozetella sp. PMI_491]|nr:cytochrome P450 [Thozetella sp. PMI_491]